MTTTSLIKARAELIDVTLQALLLNDHFFNDTNLTTIDDIFSRNIVIKDFNNMLIRIPGSGVLNIHNNELSNEGEDFRKQFPSFNISYEDNELHIQHPYFSKFDCKDVLSKINQLESILYDLQDSDYEGNLEEINSIEEEIETLGNILDKTLMHP